MSNTSDRAAGHDVCGRPISEQPILEKNVESFQMTARLPVIPEIGEQVGPAAITATRLFELAGCHSDFCPFDL